MKDLPVDHLVKATCNDNLALAITQILYPDGNTEGEWDADTTEAIDGVLRSCRPDLIPPPRPQLDSYVWSCRVVFDPDSYFRLCHEHGWTPTQEGFKDWVMENLTDRISNLTSDTIGKQLTPLKETP